MNHKKRTKMIALLTAALMLLPAFSGCNNATKDKDAVEASSTKATTSETPKEKEPETTPDATEKASVKADELIVAISADPTTLEPMIQSGQAVRLIKMTLYRGLLAYQEDGQMGFEAAEKYEIGDDKITYTFHLKPNLTFHDGSDVTAEDVVYSFERMMNPDTAATFGKDFANMVDKVEAADPQTVVFTLKEPCAPFLDYLTLPEAVIVSKAYCEAGNDLSIAPMGCGPYQFKNWDKGREITVEKFTSFYKEGKPETDAIRFVITPDDTTRVNALKTGEADLIDYVPAKEVTILNQDNNFIVDTSRAPFMCLQINTTEGPLANPKVRQAIAYAIDRRAVIDIAFDGRGSEIFGFPTQVGQGGYDGKFDNYFAHDLEKAKELLAEAGYPDGFEVKILSTSTYEFHKQTALIVQDSLKKINIKAEADLPDWGTRIERSNVGDYEILVSGTAGNIVDMDWCTNYFASGETRMNSAPGFADEEVDKLLKEGRETVDESRRQEIYDALRLRILETSPFVFINFREQSFARSSDVEGFTNLPGILTYNSGITLENTYKLEK